MRFSAALFSMFLVASGSMAQALETTTELGITVTADQVIDSILEMEGYWPPVRSYIGSERFAVADASIRQKAVVSLKSLDRLLSARLASDDEAVGEDLARYVGARLRKYECYRRLRSHLADDALTIRLKGVLELGMDECFRLPEMQREEQTRKVMERMEEEMKSAALPAGKEVGAMNLWKLLAEAKARIIQTEAGESVRQFRCTMEQSPSEDAKLTLSVLDATEWAMIAKSENTSITRKDFLAAWETIAQSKARTVPLTSAP